MRAGDQQIFLSNILQNPAVAQKIINDNPTNYLNILDKLFKYFYAKKLVNAKIVQPKNVGESKENLVCKRLLSTNIGECRKS